MKRLRPALLLAALALPARAQEGSENEPPVVNDISAAPNASSATITWGSDQPSDTQVEFGLTAAYGSSTALEPALALLHTAILTPLVPSALYHYRVMSRSAAGALGVSTAYTFTAADPSPPRESTPPSVVVMTPATGAFVAKTVAVSANAVDNVGVTSVTFLLDGAAFGSTLTSAPYSFQWDTLATPAGPHNLAAVASDASGNTATSQVIALIVDNAPPEITGLSAAPAGPGAFVVRWKTNERSDAHVEYGTTTAYGRTATAEAGHFMEHAAGLPGLAPASAHHYRALSRDQAGNLAVTGDAVFTTGAAPSAGASPQAAPDGAAARAPQKLLTPARRDGVNDAAEFGPEAKEVTILDVRGRRIYHATSPSPSSPVIWDCRDGAGRLVESGIYIATIVKRDGGRLTQSFSIAK